VARKGATLERKDNLQFGWITHPVSFQNNRARMNGFSYSFC